jgi:hypothetical protein
MKRAGAKTGDQTEFVRGTILAIRTPTCVSQSDDGRTDHQDSGRGIETLLVRYSIVLDKKFFRTTQNFACSSHRGYPIRRHPVFAGTLMKPWSTYHKTQTKIIGARP